jgi:hypothetical protein
MEVLEVKMEELYSDTKNESLRSAVVWELLRLVLPRVEKPFLKEENDAKPLSLKA